MPHRLSAAGAAVVGLLVAAGSAAGATPDVLYTTSADFDRGTLDAVNHGVPDQLQLDAGRPALPFVTVAASKRGTIIRIDADTGRIVGEYISAPEDRGEDPSAVTIDRKGNAWYADRAEHGNNQGAVGRIGVVVGGTRVRADRTPDP